MKAREHLGFTLLELSIVLVIIALVTGMAVQSGISVVETARLTATQNKMKAIDNALMQYRTANDRLPCPADLTVTQGSANLGLEAGAGAGSAIGVGTGVCTGAGMLPQANFTGTGATNTFATAAEGALPAVTLGLPSDFMVDGWGDRFRYAVDVSYTASAAFANINIGCTNGAVTVNDSNGNARSTGSVYALISHGANGHGAYTTNGVTVNAGSVNANELTNCHCNSSGTATAYAPTYVQMQQSQDPSNALDNFDDLVTYRERWQMQTAWDKTGVCIYVYVSDYNNDRIEVFNTSGSYVKTFGSPGSSGGHFSHPEGMAIDANGNIWIADTGNHRIQEFSSSGTWMATLGNGASCASCLCTAPAACSPVWPYHGNGNGQFDFPDGVALDSNGNIYVVDWGNYRIQKFDKTGNYLLQWGSQGSGNGQFNSMSNIALDAAGNVYVSDLLGGGFSRVQEFTNGGTYITQFGTYGGGNGQFYYPHGMAFDASGNLWVADNFNYRVQEFNGSGFAYMNKFGTYGNGNGQFEQPLDVKFDSAGNIYVLDTSNYRVEKFTNGGSYLLKFGSNGTGNGQFNTGTYFGGIAISSR